MIFGIGSTFSKGPESAFSEGLGPGLGPLYKVCPLKNVNFSLLFFKWRSYDSDFWPISLGDLSKILGAEMVFQSKLPRKLRPAFFLELRFMKIPILVT